MSEPTEREQLEILFKIQRLLEEGRFEATYKFALLQALIDLSVEKGHDDDRELKVLTSDIAVKFIASFWPQVRPFAGSVRRQPGGSALSAVAEGGVTYAAGFLCHGKGRSNKIPGIVRDLFAECGGSLATARAHRSWRRAVLAVRATVCVHPLWYLQHALKDAFLFAQPRTQTVVEHVHLCPGVQFTLRRFQHLLREMVRGAWIGYLRGLPANKPILGETEDLEEFLFGQPRRSLAACRQPLFALQAGRCFYCGRRLDLGSTHVDHFIPWSRYPSNLAHNLVASHAKCNGEKLNHLVDVSHLHQWRVGLEVRGNTLADALVRQGISANLDDSLAIAAWAYGQAESAGALVWLRKKDFVPLEASWRSILGPITRGGPSSD